MYGTRNATNIRVLLRLSFHNRSIEMHCRSVEIERRLEETIVVPWNRLFYRCDLADSCRRRGASPHVRMERGKNIKYLSTVS